MSAVLKPIGVFIFGPENVQWAANPVGFRHYELWQETGKAQRFFFFLVPWHASVHFSSKPLE